MHSCRVESKIKCIPVIGECWLFISPNTGSGRIEAAWCLGDYVNTPLFVPLLSVRHNLHYFNYCILTNRMSQVMRGHWQ